MPYIASKNEVEALFTDFGELADFKLDVYNSESEGLVNKGFGNCTYIFPENAIEAFNKLDGFNFKGRILHILPGKQEAENLVDNSNGESFMDFAKDNENKNFADFKQDQLKKSAQK